MDIRDLESRRVGYWWAERMLDTARPLEEKIALFWHGHVATAQDTVRDSRKRLAQIEMFERHAPGTFGGLLVAVAQHPGMRSYLDAGVHVKAAGNENVARQVIELFTMGVGNYTAQDVREGARVDVTLRRSDSVRPLQRVQCRHELAPGHRVPVNGCERPHVQVHTLHLGVQAAHRR